jgi:signal transduction histidine kinase
MFDFLTSDGFMPHGHCYFWEPGVLWLQVLTNGLIGISYVLIASTLAYLVKKGRFVPFKGMALAFGLFIMSCGVTHFMDIFVIWTPAYWLDGWIRAFTAFVSFATALILFPLVPKALSVARGARAAREHGIKLESAVDELKRMYEKATELDQLKTQFFSNVSHELRTPLTLILGPAEKLRSAPNLTEAQKHDLDVVLRNGQALLKHVNDLLDVSRLEAGKTVLHYKKVNLDGLVRQVASQFESIARDRGMSFTVPAAEPISAELDADKIQRVVLNLLSNAFKFTGTNGQISCRVAREGQDGIIEVSDSGPGVRPDERDIIFQRFRQSQGGLSRKFGGTGLGLAIVKDFVELHHGNVSVTDAPQGGALFTVRLPLQAPAGTDVQATSEQASFEVNQATQHALDELRARVEVLAPGGDAQKPRVLVVEDNVDMNRFICESLLDRYQLTQAFDGKDGLEKALALAPDLILSDIMMPEMSGDMLVSELRKRPQFENTPILLLTAKAEDDLRVNLLQHGAQDYVTKPFAADELRARVENLITMKRTRDVLQSEIETQMADLEKLANEVTHRKRELETALESMRIARETAERASQLKSNFLSLVSHELRSPLATLQLQLERMRVEDDANMSEQARTLLGRMTRSAERLHSMVDSLLNYIRIESGRLELEVSQIEVPAFLAEVIDDLKAQADDKGLELRLSKVDSIAPIVSDARLLRLTLVNLISNAIKFTETGRVTLSAATDDGHHFFHVSDTGPGISKDAQVRIFEPFEQVEDMRKKHKRGFGLGLTLVREMVIALQGSVEVESQIGSGSVFTVRLPSRLDES